MFVHCLVLPGHIVFWTLCAAHVFVASCKVLSVWLWWWWWQLAISQLRALLFPFTDSHTCSVEKQKSGNAFLLLMHCLRCDLLYLIQSYLWPCFKLQVQVMQRHSAPHCFRSFFINIINIYKLPPFIAHLMLLKLKWGQKKNSMLLMAVCAMGQSMGNVVQVKSEVFDIKFQVKSQVSDYPI